MRAKIAVADWEEAVEKVGEVMVGAGLVKETYTEAMKDTVRELGAYCVIAPGIAMPHSRPEFGVNSSGFSLVTLSTPVEFGSKENDPVDIVIGFCAVDKERHIEALRELATYFGDDSFISAVRSANSNEELVQAVKGEGKIS